MVKAIDKWLLPYLKRHLSLKTPKGPKHLILTVCDHYEPLSPRASKTIQQGEDRVNRWLDEWPDISQRHQDSDGKSPVHSIFFPAEAPERPDHFIPMLEPLVTKGHAEIEVHLHHDDDTVESLTPILEEFRDYLHERKLLGIDADGNPRYAFIHGNWTLCNGRPDGKYCGVNEELDVLLDTGCYVDYTFPSIPDPTQPRNFCNQIYFSKTIPGRPRSYDKGRLAKVGLTKAEDELLLMQGPAGLNWKWRKWGVIPRIENADLCKTNPPTSLRAQMWIDEQIHVQGRPEWLFIKLHTHGCLEGNMQALLDGPLSKTYAYLEQLCEKCEDLSLHYVSAREMANLAFAAIDGKSGNPNEYRDYHIMPNR